jgi:hypothetical protein
MKQKTYVTSIVITERQAQYAKALSLRVSPCKRNKQGSIAHGLKWSLEQQAKLEKILLE